MVEKKILVDGLRLSYNGPFEVVEFYRFVEDWIQSRGKEKELKKKLEYSTPNGKKIEWNIEIWENIADYAKSVVRMRALFNDVKEVYIVKDKHKRKINAGQVLIIFDGYLETDLQGRWQQKPGFYFMRALFDKYIYKFWSEKHDEVVRKDVTELHTKLKEFFEMYR